MINWVFNTDFEDREFAGIAAVYQLNTCPRQRKYEKSRNSLNHAHIG